tara:strand:+ start:665 stop:862 length:198 start_codon:yes stop_codon:yes gene_type:complete
MIIVMNDDVKELREALGIVRLAPKLEVVMNKFKKVVNERFDGVKDSKALSKKGVLSKVQKKNTKE